MNRTLSRALMLGVALLPLGGLHAQDDHESPQLRITASRLDGQNLEYVPRSRTLAIEGVASDNKDVRAVEING